MQCNNKSLERFYAVYAYIETRWAEAHPNASNNQSNGNSSSSNNPNCIFQSRGPTVMGFAVYAFIVPSLAIFGLCANFITAIVFMRPKMTPSAFTYLAALAWFDCLSCLLITLTAFSRSLFFESTFWLAFDLQWQTPLFAITTGAANLILACVSLDRLVYLKRGMVSVSTPRLCRRIIARRMILAVICVSCLVNIPYFFIFVLHEDGTFTTTDFFYSTFYKFHNWFSFALLALLPAIFLLIGNAAILIAFRRWTEQNKKCQKQCNAQKRYQHQMKLTITILIVITLYLIGELPAQLTSRKCVLNLLFGGDVSRVDFKTMEHLEVICITLNALQLSLNIMVYALINPSFMPEFFICLRAASDVCFRFLCFTAVIECFGRYFQRSQIQNQSSTTVWSNGDVTDGPDHTNARSMSLRKDVCGDEENEKDYSNLDSFVWTSLELRRHSVPPVHLKTISESVD